MIFFAESPFSRLLFSSPCSRCLTFKKLDVCQWFSRCSRDQMHWTPPKQYFLAAQMPFNTRSFLSEAVRLPEFDVLETRKKGTIIPQTFQDSTAHAGFQFCCSIYRFNQWLKPGTSLLLELGFSFSYCSSWPTGLGQQTVKITMIQAWFGTLESVFPLFRSDSLHTQAIFYRRSAEEKQINAPLWKSTLLINFEAVLQTQPGQIFQKKVRVNTNYAQLCEGMVVRTVPFHNQKLGDLKCSGSS